MSIRDRLNDIAKLIISWRYKSYQSDRMNLQHFIHCITPYPCILGVCVVFRVSGDSNALDGSGVGSLPRHQLFQLDPQH
jgi:hypothetical protein